MSLTQDALGQLSPARRELVRRRLEALNARAGEARQSATIPRVPRGGDLPLSFAQQRLWFIEQLEGPGARYNEFAAEIIDGSLNVPALVAALTEVHRRHEVLRTVFPEVDGAPVQRIQDGATLPLERVDLSGLPAEAREPEMRRLAEEEAARPFDLIGGPLARFTLVELDAERHVLFVSMHHVVCDRWSTAILVREVSALYDAFRAGTPSPLTPLSTQFADYAAWQRDQMETPEAAADLDAWTNALRGAPFLLDLPADRPRPQVQGSAGAAIPFTIDEATTAALHRRSRELGVTPFMALHAAFLALVYRYTGRHDVVIGAPVANRELPELESLIGFFVNTLPLRVAFDPGASFASLVESVRRADADAFARRQTPLEQIVQAVQPERSLSHSPLFQLLFVFQNAPAAEARIPGLTLTTTRSERVDAKFDLTLTLAEDAGRMTGAFEYSTELFDRDRIARMVDHFQHLLASALADPETPVAALKILGEREEADIRAWGTGAVPAAESAPLHDLLSAQARRTPDNLALEAGDRRLTYAELDLVTDRMAAVLRTQGVGPGALAAIGFERSADMVLTLLAVLKAGAAYLPLDPAHPHDRLAYMLGDSGASCVIASRTMMPMLPIVEGVTPICFDDAAAAWDGDRPQPCDRDPRSLAYVIYTSGSTGRPKGVQVEHRGLTNLALAQSRAFGVGPDSRVLQFASLTFDASISEIAMALVSGAALVVPGADQIRPGADLERTLDEGAITHVTLPPAALGVMSPEALPRLTTLIVAGEACPEDIAVAWSRGRRFFNAYGPTEATVCATICEYPGTGHPTIGSPMAGQHVYIVDRHLTPVPIGVPGELCIGGAGVARGYLGRPELTTERFVPDPFSETAGARLYRTGDLARFREDGAIEFLGRIDHQVKIRGYRIELDEIARTLESHPSVRQAVVTVVDRSGDRRLAAYYTASEETDPVEIRGFLARALPEYMLPAHFVPLDELPLTVAGKVDRQRLPQPRDVSADTSATRDGVEDVVLGLFRQVLRAPGAGPRTNFFDAGGHSLLAVQLLARIRDTWSIEIGLRDFFAHPVAQATADLVRDRLRAAAGTTLPPIERVSRDQALPLSFAQRRLWFLDQLEGANVTYNISAALRLEGDLDLAALRRSFTRVVERHEALRTTFPLADGVPVQRISPPPHEVLSVEDRFVPDDRRLRAMRDAEHEEASRPFDLAAGPLFRARLLRMAPDDSLLLVTMHHVVSDGWSMALLIEELAALYRGYSADQTPTLAPLPVQYADFAAWQHRWLTDARLERELGFWRERMKGAPGLLELPTDRPRPAARTTGGGVERFTLDADVVARLREAGGARGATLFMTLMAGFTAVLSRYSRQHDIVLGTGMANRNLTDTESVVGLFVNTLALRTDVSGDPTFAELIDRVRQVTLDAYAHQDVPFERLVEELQPERSLSHTPLFQVMFAMQNVPSGGLQLPGVRVTAIEPDEASAKFDLTVFLEETASGVSGSVVYSTDLFEGPTVARMLRHYANFLGAAADTPGEAISSLPLMDAAETRQVVRTFAATAAPAAVECLHVRFEAAVERHPDRIAVSMDDVRMTYRELNARANRLARSLCAMGVEAGDLVGLCLERSPDTIVGLLAILKAGGAYVPLDPSYPADRLADMIGDSGIRVLVAERRVLPRLPSHGADLCFVDEGREGDDGSNLHVEVTPEHLCYVIYTSGSTGRPKGSLVCHRNVARLFDATDAWFHFDEQDVWTFFHSSAFDFSVWEIWGALLYGGRLVVVPYLVSRSPREFRRLLDREQVTILNQTPSAFAQLLEVERDASGRLGALRSVIFGGEALDLRSLRPWVAKYGDAQPQLVNMYGITETTVHVTYRPLRAADLESPRSLIGIPIPDLALYVLDERMQPVPVGVPGELYVGGEGLASGYLNRADLTAQRFVPNPFARDAGPGGATLYRTGDMVRLLADGELEYLGRADHQIKIRGFRIEPGEIEAALASHDAVQDVLVLAREEDGDKRLVAYVVPSADAARPLLRLLQWQREGQVEADALIELPNGMTVAHLNRTETEFVYREIFEDQSYFRHGVALRDGATIVDVGANIGLFSLFASRACRHPRIYAFEPIPQTFACLERNTTLHGLDARVFQHGLAADTRTDTFTFYPNVSIISGRFGDVGDAKRMIRAFLMHGEASTSVGAPLIDELLDERLEQQSVPCLLRPLSDVIDDEGIEVIDLLKVDVEKSELDVLSGIRDDHWPIVRQVIAEVHDSEGRLDAIVSLLRRHGFQVAVDRDEQLTDTELFNVYASREGVPAAAGPQAPAAWSSRDRFVADLREHVSGRLPAYMVPSSIVLLDRFPLTVNGKIDRAALPSPSVTIDVASSRHVPPRDEIEARLAAIFADVLRAPAIGVTESFFDAGGHSLLATQVVSRVRDAFRVELPLQALFQSPTVDALADHLRGTAAPAADDVIARRTDGGEARLSFAQERLWFLDQLEPGNPFYNVPLVLRLRGQLDVAVLERCLHEVLRRHDVLRARFVTVDGQPVQQLRDVEACGIRLAETLVDLTALPGPAQDARVDALAREDAVRPFDLAADPLLRVRLIRLDEAHAVLLFTMHHIVSDGWSLGVLVHELGTLYEAFQRGLPSPLADPPLQYADFAAWQRGWLDGPVLERQVAYWTGQLAGVPPVLELPTDRQRPPVQSFRGGSCRFELGPELTTALRALSRAHDTTLFMSLLAVFASVLHRYSGQPDIVIGAPIANRTRREIEPLIGFFVNTLALRADVTGDPTFAELLARLRATTLGAYAHQDVPFERLVDEIHPERDLSLNPLFQVMFALQNAPIEPLLLTGLEVEAVEREATSALFDLVLDVWETGDRLVGNLQFNADLFDRSTIERLVGHYTTLAASAASAPGQRVSALALVPPAEAHELDVVGRGPRAAYPIDRTLIALFEDTAAAHPHAVAIRHRGTGLTYAELDARANRIAHWLRGAGVGRGGFVALLDHRGIDTLASMLGVLKAGAAFLPIDAAYPPERVAHMLRDSGASVVITRGFALDGVTRLDLDSAALDTLPATPVASPAAPEDVAYLLYTSGSTGLPKGAMVRHNGAVNHIYAEFELLRFHAGTVFLQSAPSSSDISVWQFLAPGLIGGRTVIADYETVADPARLFALIRDERVTLVELVPVVMKALLDHVAALPIGERALPALEWAMVTGESVPVALVNQWIAAYPSVPIVNAYGPTEAADDICQAVIAEPLPEDARTTPIGRPLANLRLYILDRDLRPVPFGVVGEIGVSGVGVGAGYWQDARRTAAAFVANPYADGGHDTVIYRTGDRGRWRADGTLECLGRVDEQVKVRGFRIELGEIEAVLGQHPSVAMNAVATPVDAAGERRLVAYVVPDAAAEETREQAQALRDEQIGLWRRLHEDSYTDTLLRQDDPTFNVIGWDSNYTNEPLPEADLREYVGITVDRIRELGPSRVLEIGCGTGLIMFALLPDTTEYCATDLSQVAIRQLQDLQRRPDLQRRVAGLDRARLVQTPADVLDGVETGVYDTAILPSVVQYFPSIDYVVEVLDRLMATLTPGASLFIGDVRSLPLLEAFHLSVQLFKSPGAIPVSQLTARVQQQLEREQELAIDPAFFAALPHRFPQITSVEILPKRGTQQNEMTRFRYDVRIRTAAVGAASAICTWMPAVFEARTSRERIARAWIADGRPFEDVDALRAALAAVPDTLESESAWIPEAMPSVDPARPWSDYASDPLREKMRRGLTAALRDYLRARLPQYMVPSEYAFLDALPLTPAGKVDRQALPDPAQLRAGAADEYVAPRTPVEERLSAIWGEVLGLERVGIRSNFFELGGHSLKATQVTSRVRRDLGVEIALRELFVAPTIETFAARIEAAGTATDVAAAIPKAPDAAHYPLSPAQRRLWVLCQMDGASSAYGIPAAVRLDGALSASALQSALDALIARHESLRTAFVVVDGEPRQRVLPAVTRPITLVDLSGHASPDDEARRLAVADAGAAFDLEAGGLLRASLLRLASDRHILLFNIHHIVSDDWSGTVLVRELVQIYAAGSADALPPLPIQYRDYAVWQQQALQGGEMAAHRQYWIQQLSGDIPPIDLPTDGPRPPVKTYAGLTHSFAFSPEDSVALAALARAQGASLFMVLTALVKTLLHRYTAQRDLVIGIPIAGRTRPELEDQIGFFINMLALRDAIDPEASFEGVLQQVKRTATRAYEHQDYPFDRIVNELNLNRDVSRTPLFDVVVVLQNAESAALELPGVRVEALPLEYGFSKYDLQFAFEERGGQLRCDLVYNTDLFAESRIRRIGAHLATLTGSVLRDASQPVGALDILPDDERRLVLDTWSASTPVAPVAPRTLVETFEAIASRHADRIALTMPGGESLTYAELDARANQVAHTLMALGVHPGGFAGLCTERGPALIVGLLGILKAGAAYVPIDPAYPAERQRFMLEDTGARAVVTDHFVADAITHAPRANPGVAQDAQRAAYVIYTSGSTGQPKGVEVTHANVSRLFTSTDHWFAFDEHDVWTLFHSSTFDFSVWEIWGALLYGGRLVIVPRDVSRAPEACHALVVAEQVTVLNQTPSAFKPFASHAVAAGSCGRLRYVVFGGEALDVPGLRPWFDAFGDEQPRLVNMYGITETTVHVTYRPITREDVDRPASVIGAPIPDLRLYILDEHRRPVPIGVTGELYVGGAGLARGYVNRPELTAARFVSHDAATGGPASPRLYRSGDLARFLDDGDIEYLGRADQQVKIRGFRIELGEVEAALAAHPAVATAVVLARRAAEAVRLVAYVVFRNDAPDPAELRAHLQRTLPEYMVPSAFVALPALPLTANGKLDRAALPDPDDARLAPAEFVAPQEGYETTIAAIVGDVLRVGRVGAHDNFFDLGADSLLLAMVHTRIRDAIGRDLSLVALYTHPTVSALAASLAPVAEPPKTTGQSVDERAAKQREARRPRRRD